MEYGRSTLPDRRLRIRLTEMGRRWEENPAAPVCVVFPQRAEQKTAYRFLSNERVTMDDILEPHREALTERCRLERTVLVAQDTTTLNYTSRWNSTSNLGKIGGGGRGLMVDASLAFTEAVRPLGVLTLDVDTRKPADELSEASEECIRWFAGLAMERAGRPARCRVINICDREGDIYDLTQAAAPDEAELLVRANRGRQHRVVDGDTTLGLWEYMEKLSPCVAHTVQIAARGGQHAREKRAAHIELRIARVALCAPGASSGTLEVSAVYAIEPSPSDNSQALSWMLLCTDGEATAENALRMLDRLAREKPAAPALDVLSKDDVEALYILLLDQRIIPKRPPKPPDIRISYALSASGPPNASHSLETKNSGTGTSS